MFVSGEQWHAVQSYLKDHVSDDDFSSWLEPLTPVNDGATDGPVTLTVPTSFMQDWIERHYESVLRQGLAETLQKPVDVAYKVTPLFGEVTANKTLEAATVAPAAVAQPEAISAPMTELMAASHLDPKYTFDTFVTGKSNDFAYAAARRIAESEDAAYNPFFLYGGVGLGKTHLMHAIGAHIHASQPQRKVLYISAEQFLFRFIRALKDRSTLSFKETFRAVDVLMIDDIQFIAGKEATQEEFFHTFNALVSMGKQVILTADRSPHEMANIEDRLRSRLGCGLACEIHAPEVETRLAILERKAEELEIELPQSLGMFLASSIASNVRELEGALNRLAAFSKLSGAELTIAFAQEHLKDLFRAHTRVVTLDDIQKRVADYYTIRIADLNGTRRNRDIARPRQAAMYLAKTLTTKSYPEIGKSFGGRDHTTVMHAVKTIENLMEKDPTLKEDVALLEKMLTSR